MRHRLAYKHHENLENVQEKVYYSFINDFYTQEQQKTIFTLPESQTLNQHNFCISII